MEERAGQERAVGLWTLVAIGLFLLGGWLAIGLWGPALKPWRMAGSAMALIGAALAIAGLCGLLFRWAMQHSFEWLIAWRYLRVQHQRSWVTFGLGVGLLVAAVALMIASYVWGQPRLGELLPGPSPLQQILRFVALGLGVLAHWVLFFGFLMLFFSLFTTISIFTVFLGLEALVAVLSMMGGFEEDLRQKILGATAHVVITKPQGVFSDYHAVGSRVGKLKGVVALSPYLESEVMVTSQSNLSGVVLRGIDPQALGRVTEIPRFLRNAGGSGSLDNLNHPERLSRIPEARFQPLIPPPLDEAAPAGSAGPEDHTERPVKAPGDREPQQAAGEPEVKMRSWGLAGQVGMKVPPRPLYPGIIIGAELAKNLRLYVGDDVNMVAPLGGMSPAGPIPKSKPFRVAGIFYSGLYECDNKQAFVTTQAAQNFLGLDDEVTGIELKVRSLEDAAAVAESARQLLRGQGYLVQDWRERNVNLFSALQLEKLVMFIVLGFIVLVASFSIVTNLNMVVLEKQREIAALKAMGAANPSLLRIFLYAGLYIGVIGMLVGVLAGIGICTLLADVGLPLNPEIYYISELPVRMNPVDIAIVALAGVTLSFLATIYPSLLAGRLKPADGLRRHDT